MATFVLIPGAGGAGEVYWREAAAELEARGHVAIPVEIEGDDPALGLHEYAAITDQAIGDHRDVVLVAQSMGAFIAPMISKSDAIDRIVLLNAMIPIPGESPGEWFETTGSGEARRAANEAAGRSNEFDLENVFLHDVPDRVKADMAEGDREPAETPFGQSCTFEVWPDVPIHVLVGADDRLFPAEFQVRVARDRLCVEADVMPGGHMAAKSRPLELAERLIAYLDVGASSEERSTAEVGFDLADAAAELRRVAANVRGNQLDAPTPCADWTVRDLAAHVCGLTKAFTHTARHEPQGEPRPDGAKLPDDWREQLDRDLGTLVAAWREPSAWQGEAEAGGFTMPSTELATVVLDELVLHGWDLARATGQSFTATDRDVAICTRFAAAMSTPDSREGLYGPIVDTGTDPAPLDALLGLAGRDPGRPS
ncbi:TIGR03086 family protein [Actinopolyspora lacussalsi subsp. righensis]|uniref:TIGR03086 family protein n=1 Tax=Actinopolyspora righensis TaxID=995060 RepID=A0A1I7C499_9ACTN|nr:TIGR03086 family metal-binding protein [Actinopolyspora righensis]SFT94253.1 TIGR03086 family protein [Actinopolyspora righensis]